MYVYAVSLYIADKIILILILSVANIKGKGLRSKCFLRVYLFIIYLIHFYLIYLAYAA